MHAGDPFIATVSYPLLFSCASAPQVCICLPSPFQILDICIFHGPVNLGFRTVGLLILLYCEALVTISGLLAQGTLPKGN